MRGLPPQPSDVALLVQTFDVAGLPCTMRWWLFNGSWPSAVEESAQTALADWFSTCLPQLLECQHAAVIPTTCRLEVPTLKYVELAPPAHGAWSGGLTTNAALGIAWHTLDTGRGATHITFVPGVPDVFIHDNWRLSQLGWGNLQATARDLLLNLNAIRAPDGSACIAGTLRRQKVGVPLSHAQFSPFSAVTATPKLVTIRRRIPSGSGISPS